MNARANRSDLRIFYLHAHIIFFKRFFKLQKVSCLWVGLLCLTFLFLLIPGSASARPFYAVAADRIFVFDSDIQDVVRSITVPAGATYYLTGAVGIDPNGKKAYLTTGSSNSGILEFDIPSETFGTFHPVSSNRRLQRPSVLPDRSKMFVVDQDGLVHVVNMSTWAVTNQISVGSQNFDGKLSPDGAILYVPHRDSATVSAIDTTSETVSNTISAGSGSSIIAIPSDGKFAYVLNYSDNSVSKIELSTESVVDTLAVQTNPNGACLSKDESLLYVTNYHANSISVIRLDTFQVVNHVPIEAADSDPFGIIEIDGETLFTKVYRNSTGKYIQVFDTTTSPLSYVKTLTLPVEIGANTGFFQAPPKIKIGPKTVGITNPYNAIDGDPQTYANFGWYWGEGGHSDFLHFVDYIGTHEAYSFNMLVGRTAVGSFTIEGESAPGVWEAVGSVAISIDHSKEVFIPNAQDYVDGSGNISLRARWVGGNSMEDAAIYEITPSENVINNSSFDNNLSGWTFEDISTTYQTCPTAYSERYWENGRAVIHSYSCYGDGNIPGVPSKRNAFLFYLRLRDQRHLLKHPGISI